MPSSFALLKVLQVAIYSAIAARKLAPIQIFSPPDRCQTVGAGLSGIARNKTMQLSFLRRACVEVSVLSRRMDGTSNHGSAPMFSGSAEFSGTRSRAIGRLSLHEVCSTRINSLLGYLKICVLGKADFRYANPARVTRLPSRYNSSSSGKSFRYTNPASVTLVLFR